ncbi:ATP-binding protein [Odoribacter sp. N15.MGS-14]|uniref:ATP-dependent nuclease n=1 Tax=Odoribacter sp. N15.MGS-14 TaxID=1637502 RepID=UPI000623915B|nr:ATP-binding protein [Odoribacter sp. N15.MGS-14]
MIHKLILKNFKKIKEETFEFNNFDLIVGANNSGKSTALQALAIWQYCIEQFRIMKKTGSRGIQIVLPNFTALPLPEFNLLWNNKTDRVYTKEDHSSKKEQKYIYIEIDTYWKISNERELNFKVSLRYQSPQAVFAIPEGGWTNFNELDSKSLLPRIVYIPPFSGIEPHEQWMDDGNVRQHVGKSQPGSVLRNLLYRVIDKDIDIKENEEWQEIAKQVKDWFGVELLVPQYTKGISTEIKVEYKSNGRVFDIISGGSGFHQILTLLAFFYGYPGTTMLFDEPDAHLHVNLQRKIINYFIEKKERQFLIATHSEEFIQDVDIHSILSILSGQPKRVNDNENVLKALSEIDNNDVFRTQENPYILYVEGEDDERILAAWANVLNKNEIYQKFYPYMLGGTTKKLMSDKSDMHYKALKQINPALKRILLLDYDDQATYHPEKGNSCLREWKRKNIDNYLLVPEAWVRAICYAFNETEVNLFIQPYVDIVRDFFEAENLTLPPRITWREVKANIFSVVDGKKILFENSNSLFHRLAECSGGRLKINRQLVAKAMLPEEIHEDIYEFFEALEQLIN